MARVKVTSSDVFARLARGECANYLHNACEGRMPCAVINGETCQYFSDYVRPLLDYPEFQAKYAREAKITVALNPKAKVIRKRRQANEPTLLETSKNAVVEAKPLTPLAKQSPRPATVKSTRAAAKAAPQLPLGETKSRAKGAQAEKPAAPAPPVHQEPVAPPAPKSPRRAHVLDDRPITTTITVEGDMLTRPAGTKRAAATPVDTPHPRKTDTPAVTTTVTASGDVLTRPQGASRAKTQPMGDQPQLFLEIAPEPPKRPSRKR